MFYLTNSLSKEEIKRIVLIQQIWNMYNGWEKYNNIEILRIVEFKEEGKYYPVLIRVKDSTGSGTRIVFVYDCRVIKNDYGDWEVKRIGEGVRFFV